MNACIKKGKVYLSTSALADKIKGWSLRGFGSYVYSDNDVSGCAVENARELSSYI